MWSSDLWEVACECVGGACSTDRAFNPAPLDLESLDEPLSHSAPAVSFCVDQNWFCFDDGRLEQNSLSENTALLISLRGYHGNWWIDRCSERPAASSGEWRQCWDPVCYAHLSRVSHYWTASSKQIFVHLPTNEFNLAVCWYPISLPDWNWREKGDGEGKEKEKGRGRGERRENREGRRERKIKEEGMRWER